MGPVGRVPCNFGDHGDLVYIWSPPTFATGWHFFAGHCGKLTVLSQTSLLSLRRREGKKSREGNGNG